MDRDIAGTWAFLSDGRVFSVSAKNETDATEIAEAVIALGNACGPTTSDHMAGCDHILTLRKHQWSFVFEFGADGFHIIARAPKSG